MDAKNSLLKRVEREVMHRELKDNNLLGRPRCYCLIEKPRLNLNTGVFSGDLVLSIDGMRQFHKGQKWDVKSLLERL